MKTKKKQRRNHTWMTKETFNAKVICSSPNAEVYCPNRKCLDVGDTIDLDPHEFTEHESFVCKRCGHEITYDLVDRNGDDIICRCFKVIIAKKPMNFCVSFRVCARCLFPHYKRFAPVLRKADCACGSIAGWRLFLPSPNDCSDGIHDPPPPDTAFIDTEAKERKHV